MAVRVVGGGAPAAGTASLRLYFLLSSSLQSSGQFTSDGSFLDFCECSEVRCIVGDMCAVF